MRGPNRIQFAVNKKSQWLQGGKLFESYGAKHGCGGRPVTRLLNWSEWESDVLGVGTTAIDIQRTKSSGRVMGWIWKLQQRYKRTPCASVVHPDARLGPNRRQKTFGAGVRNCLVNPVSLFLVTAPTLKANCGPAPTSI